jgi:signal transduction histidine kinase/HPt (histidine-containing phosphotransfer) domain-containing protein
MEDKAVILIVDDEVSVQRALKRELRHESAVVLVAGSAQEALQLLEESSVDVVISDLRMPGMNGIALLSEISERWPDVARVLLTGNADFPDVVRAINEGNISYFLEKPWSREQLLLIVRQFLAQTTLRNAQLRLSDQLAEKNEALANEIEVKNRLMAIMSHEIRTPLNGIHGVLQLLSDGVRDKSEASELIEAGLSSSSDLRKIVDDVLDYFRLGTEHAAVEDESFDPRRVISEVVSLMKPAASEKSLKLELEKPDALPVAGTGDPLRIRQVVTNLVSNAVRYTSTGSITIDCAGSSKDLLVVSVSDTGPGIPEEKLPLVFEEFRLLDDSHAREQGGTGLGLAICRRLVERMNGSLDVTSILGEGSCFRLTVPLGEAQEHTGSKDGNRVQASGRRVAIVDDHKVNLQLLTIMLERMGCEVLAYDGARPVLRDFRDEGFNKPDLLLTDITMPGMDGVELTRTLRSEALVETDFPIIALTAHNMAHEVEGFLSSGMSGHIAKPVQLDELREVIAGISSPSEVVPENVALESLVEEVGSDVMPVLIGSFLGDARARCDAIGIAGEGRDFESLARECHTLGSSAAQFGAYNLSVICREVERALKAEDNAFAIAMADKIDGAVVEGVTQVEAWLESASRHHATES